MPLRGMSSLRRSTKKMNMDSTESKLLAILSWVVLGGSLLTVVFLFAAIAWTWSRIVLTASIPIPEYQGLSLPASYCRMLYAGFANLTWILATIGIALVWLLPARRGRHSKRLAIAISLILVHRWLQITLVFLFMFGRFKT
jgi:hypothetical protein